MIRRASVHGHTAIFLENDRLRVGVLPEKGGDIFEFTYRQQGGRPIQFLMQTPRGLKPPAGTAASNFLDNYEGGWQELFPNANDACSYNGVDIPFHGEVALLPWGVETNPASPESVLRLSVDCVRTPFRLEREMRLAADAASLIIHEKVSNLSSEPQYFVWGQHVTLGSDFLEDGCHLEVPARNVYTPDVLYEPLTARLKPGQASAWPYAEARDGGSVDLERIPGPEARSHDDVIVGGLDRGFYQVTNPRLQLSFRLEWDASVFPWLMFWQPYGGADLPPLTGIYGVGLEPWVSRFPLARAIEEGQARCLEGHASLETNLVASVESMMD